ncbi:MAG: 23S rRNA (uracil(1939)-C(5))-methyltransferase RlmD [Lachnospiraceae bacterium]|nr:23S rRNA (uracil(1939)-C(5))-methyltransferase RlmD [Lachnospiraceae bacterium]
MSEGKRDSSKNGCPYVKKCGGCQYDGSSYSEHLKQKKKYLDKLMKPYAQVKQLVGMEHPFHYRTKVHAVMDRNRKTGSVISGIYEQGTHRVVPIQSCMIEDEQADEIILTIRELLSSFKLKIYDEDTGYGLVRHVLIRTGYHSGQIMVVLVTASPVFPSKNNFVKALRKRHPNITTIVQNINGRGTSMVLGDKEHILYGKGYIEDTLCGCVFRISSKSFYQVNPQMTEKLYGKAIELAGLTGRETVIDAYCGIGTIGLIAADRAHSVIGAELNGSAVKDAVVNAKRNGIKNIWFEHMDAGEFMVKYANQGNFADVVFMDPPRSGSTTQFIDALAYMKPTKVVYISCNPETLVRDLEYFRKKGYQVKECWGYEMFPWTSHVESTVLLQRRGADPAH